MKIDSAASAFPKQHYFQEFLLEKLQEYWGDQLRNPATLARLHRNVMKNRRPDPGTFGILAAMGPGFCSERTFKAVRLAVC